MDDLTTWWEARTKGEHAAASIVCVVFIFVAGIEIGRALYDATH